MMVLITSACGEGSDKPACTHDLARAFASRINKVCKLKKGLTSWLSFVVSSVSLSLSHWYPGSGVVLDCIDS